MAIDTKALTTLFEPIHTSTPGPNSPSYLPDILFLVVYILLTLSGIVLTIAILYGGITYITSAGDATKAAKGRSAILNGIIGAIIVILSAATIRLIQRILG